MLQILLPFLIALGTVAVFSFFAWLATRYRDRKGSRLLMWAGIIPFPGGCYLFGITVSNLSLGWIIAATGFFTVLFGLTAAYFVRKRREGS
ncbi:hypothetical protein JXM67_00175 [candidate division WOR-3 bacterium]|nr:hypothetical protein [candidate division WOR-3 bacterium]